MPSILMMSFAALSAFFFAVELRAVNPTQQLISFRQGSLGSTNPRSLLATHEFLTNCDRAMSVPIAYLRPKDDILTIAEACAGIARSVIEKMPTHGFAFFIAAVAEHHRDNHTFRDDNLAKSASFAPFEGWLAERRFALLMNLRNGETTPQTTIVAQDISTLLTTQTGAELLASYYTLRPEIRDQINAVSALTSPANQTRLSNQLILKRAGK